MKVKLWLAIKKFCLVVFCIEFIFISCIRDHIFNDDDYEIYMPGIIRVHANLGNGTYKVKDKINTSIIIPNKIINGKTLKEYVIESRESHKKGSETGNSSRPFTEKEILEQGIEIENFDLIFSEAYLDYPEFGLNASSIIYLRQGENRSSNYVRYDENLDLFESYLGFIIDEQIDPKTGIKYKVAKIRNNVYFKAGVVVVKTRIIENYEGEYFTLNIEDINLVAE